MRLLTVARNRRDRQFLIPSVGVAPSEGGYAREQITPLFATAPATVARHPLVQARLQPLVLE